MPREKNGAVHLPPWLEALVEQSSTILDEVSEIRPHVDIDKFFVVRGKSLARIYNSMQIILVEILNEIYECPRCYCFTCALQAIRSYSTTRVVFESSAN